MTEQPDATYGQPPDLGIASSCLRMALADAVTKHDVPALVKAFEDHALWETDQKEADAIRICAEDILQADETYVRGWILESLNEWDMAQERIVIITTLVLYRIKYDFKDDKMVHYHRLLLQDVASLEHGHFKAPSMSLAKVVRNKAISRKYGIRLCTTVPDGNSSNKDKETGMYYRSYRPRQRETPADSEAVPYVIAEIVLALWATLMLSKKNSDDVFLYDIANKEITRNNRGAIVSLAYNKMHMGHSKR